MAKKQLRHKAYKFRIYPTEDQKVLINKTIGSTRFVFNTYLDAWNRSYNEMKKGATYYSCAMNLRHMKRKFTWLKEVDSIALQTSIRDLADGFTRYFKGQNDKPNFKSKNKDVKSYTTKFVNNNIVVSKHTIKLPKLGLVKYANNRRVEGRIMNATVRRSSSDKYYVSILAETSIEELPKTNSEVGIDLGISDFAILSNGEVIKNLRYYRSLEEKLAKAQRILSRRKVGSHRWYKQKLKLNKIHDKITNRRTDFLQKLTTDLIKNHDVIAIEDLRVKNMMQNKKLAKSISDVSWTRFRDMLEYKAIWYGKKVVAIDTFFPSSQLCSYCGYRNKFVKDLGVRVWDCEKCLEKHDRDLNASFNILDEGKRLLSLEKAS